MESDKRSLKALRLMTLLDRRIGMELDKSSTKGLIDGLSQIVDFLLSNEEIPDSLKKSVMNSLTKVRNEFWDNLATVEIPNMERILLALRSLQLPVDSEHRKFVELRKNSGKS